MHSQCILGGKKSYVQRQETTGSVQCLPSPLPRLVKDESAGVVGVVRVLDADGDVVAHGGLHADGVQDLGPKVGQLRGLGKGHLPRFKNNTRRHPRARTCYQGHAMKSMQPWSSADFAHRRLGTARSTKVREYEVKRVRGQGGWGKSCLLLITELQDSRSGCGYFRSRSPHFDVYNSGKRCEREREGPTEDTGTAVGTTRGSAVSIPSTSFHTCRPIGGPQGQRVGPLPLNPR